MLWLYLSISTEVLLHWIPNIWSMEQKSYLVSLMSKNTICFVSKNSNIKFLFHQNWSVLASCNNGEQISVIPLLFLVYISKYFKSYSRSFIESKLNHDIVNSIQIHLYSLQMKTPLDYLISRYAFFTLIDLIFVKYFRKLHCMQSK